MPDFYCTPEVILGIEWDEKVDVWCVGMMVCPETFELLHFM